MSERLHDLMVRDPWGSACRERLKKRSNSPSTSRAQALENYSWVVDAREQHDGVVCVTFAVAGIFAVGGTFQYEGTSHARHNESNQTRFGHHVDIDRLSQSPSSARDSEQGPPVEAGPLADRVTV